MENYKTFDICIIGGGAAGIAAAICAKRINPTADIVIIEKNDQIGKKLSATGNGRCNIFNMNCLDRDMTIEFLESLGIETTVEGDGWVYPVTNRADDVIKLLQMGLNSPLCYGDFDSNDNIDSIKVMVNSPVTLIRHFSTPEEIKENNVKNGAFFEINIEKQSPIRCKRLLIATGGKAAPMFGTTGDGYIFARALGHTINKLYPILAPVIGNFPMLNPELSKSLKGTRVKCNVKLLRKGEEVFSERGEVQITAYGLSGIVIYNASRHIILDENTNFEDYKFSLDFLPDMSVSQIKKKLDFRAERGLPFFDGLVTGRLATALMELARLEVELGRYKANEKANDIYCRMLKEAPFQVTDVKGWKDAQATAGGVSLDEIDLSTMESKLVPGLYFAGEVIDKDGPCGGYNLQNAWATGIKAGRDIPYGL